ncbi:MAG: hypothetical protein OXT67_03190 [Zetaproteobacteria bacterium]|nr:hypothetical protein [Zetaproteobacteria bacterium]
MAQLDLVPNPTIVMAQLGIFSAALVVVNKLYVAPYLKLRSARESRTEGRDANVKSLTQARQEKAEYLQQAMKHAYQEIALEKQKLHRQAVLDQDEIVKKAREESAAHFEQRRVAIQSQFEQARQDARTKVPELVDSLYRRLINPH